MVQDKPTVLYVDDLPMNLKLFEATFRKDYNIILSEDPFEALKILEEKEVQILVSDQRMPGMSGTELLEIAYEYGRGG
jgi:two-component system sensor histidine kinase/response regulator